MLQLPGKNIAFVFSDTAGGNACIAMAEMCRLKGGIKTSLYTNKPFPGSATDDITITQAVPEFRKLGVDCVFTGTSHPQSSNNFEIDCIRQSVRDHIYTISFIDHWVNFKLRFDGLQPSQYPDEIWVLDEAAKSLAVADGLPVEKLIIKENPYHYYLKHHWHETYTDKSYLEKFGIPETGFHILFAPDPLSIRNGKQSAGFTEEDALEDLLFAISELPGEIHLIIKCHPLQPVDNLKLIIEKNKKQSCYLIKEVDALELINAVDLVIGFYSNLLLEADVIGKKVVRYFPGNDAADLLKHKHDLKKIKSKEELKDKLKLYV